MLGYRAEEVVGGATPALFLDRRHRADVRGLRDGARLQRRRETRELTYVRKDGTRLRVSQTLTTERGARRARRRLPRRRHGRDPAAARAVGAGRGARLHLGRPRHRRQPRDRDRSPGADRALQPRRGGGHGLRGGRHDRQVADRDADAARVGRGRAGRARRGDRAGVPAPLRARAADRRRRPPAGVVDGGLPHRRRRARSRTSSPPAPTSPRRGARPTRCGSPPAGWRASSSTPRRGSRSRTTRGATCWSTGRGGRRTAASTRPAARTPSCSSPRSSGACSRPTGTCGTPAVWSSTSASAGRLDRARREVPPARRRGGDLRRRLGRDRHLRAQPRARRGARGVAKRSRTSWPT